MASWETFTVAAPDLAAAVQRRFDAHGHKTMATLRKDGSPRISGTEVQLRDGQLWIGSMPDARKALDLRRDGRIAIHSGSDEPDGWNGDAKVAGTAVEVTDEQIVATFAEGAPPGPFHLFRIELREAVVVSLGDPADHLVIESWHEEKGVTRIERK